MFISLLLCHLLFAFEYRYSVSVMKSEIKLKRNKTFLLELIERRSKTYKENTSHKHALNFDQ